MTRNVDQLRSIQTFEELIPFLEDDLDWPFPHGSQEYEFDDLTFEYTPDELGLEDEYAAKIKGIHQLRPLGLRPALGHLFCRVREQEASNRCASPHSEPPGPEATEIGQSCRPSTLECR